jgi:hypothetical protein
MPGTPPRQWFFDLHRKAWTALAIGLPLALVLTFWTCLGTIMMPLPVIIHELGHAITAWAFACPAVPAFDFRYGGGVAVHYDQIRVLLLVPAALIIYLGYLARRDIWLVAWVGVLAVVFAALAFTTGREVVIKAMGHGFELFFAVIFLFRAMTGIGVIVPAERPLYAMLGFWFDFHNIRFAHNLMTDPVAQQAYIDAKGGGDWMDFAQISRDVGWSQNSVVALYMFLCIMVIPLSLYLAMWWMQKSPAARAREMPQEPELDEIGTGDTGPLDNP